MGVPIVRLTIFILSTAIISACAPPDSERCGDEFYFDGGNCHIIVEQDTTDWGTDGDSGLGGPCQCQGEGCEQMGMPIPTGGTITGCESVPLPWTGAELACMRTSTGDLGASTFFANGFCTLMAVACQGDAMVCENAVVGDYATMTSCPPGAALLMMSGEVDMMGFVATLQTKQCAPLCQGDGDCRIGETDPVLDNEPSQYGCQDIGGVKFCYDPRDLSEDVTAQAF